MRRLPRGEVREWEPQLLLHLPGRDILDCCSRLDQRDMHQLWSWDIFISCCQHNLFELCGWDLLISCI